MQDNAFKLAPVTEEQGWPPTVTEIVFVAKLRGVGSEIPKERVVPDLLREVTSVYDPKV